MSVAVCLAFNQFIAVTGCDPLRRSLIEVLSVWRTNARDGPAGKTGLSGASDFIIPNSAFFLCIMAPFSQ
jgi:hypothetical protein